MTRKLLFLLLLILLFPCLSRAQEPRKGTYHAMRGEVPGNYDFWLYTPTEYDAVPHRTPLIIFLHGASLCGRDLNKVRRYGVLDAIDRGKIVDALVLAPQNPGGAWSPAKINDLLEWTKQHYEVDSTRVFVLGMSLGGYGTMDFVGTYPEKVAAAMALCGGCSLRDLSGLGRVPLWIMHGTADRAVNIKESRRVVQYLQEHHADSLLRYDWLKGASHGLPARLLYLQKTYDWLTAHSLADEPRVADRSFDITMSDIRQTYQELRWFKGMFEDD